MASRNVSAGNSGNLAEIDSDPEDVPTSSLAEGRTLRGPKRAINYGDRMPYRQGAATQLLRLNNRSFSLKKIKCKRQFSNWNTFILLYHDSRN